MNQIAIMESKIEVLCKQVDDLKKDLALNASMLARQCDLARDSEQRAETAERQNAELKLKIQKAINRLADIHDH